MLPSSEGPAEGGSLRGRLLDRWPYLALVVLGLGLIWPVALGRMPMSADHTVHIARAEMWSRTLLDGSLRGWSSTWFMGGPIGEFYPPLGDLLVLGLRALTLGSLGWGSAYAFTFAFVFCLQGLSLCFVARRLNFADPLSFVVGALALLDLGFMREGGWLYTVDFGVWPQVLSTSALWIAIGLCLPDLSPRDEEQGPRISWSGRRIAALGLAWGCALLAHPAALPCIVLLCPVWLAFIARGLHGGRNSVALALSLILGGCLAAWWLSPMLENRAWMASYGWLYASTETMSKWALKGQWTHNMPSLVGWMASLGMLLALVRGPGVLRLVAVYGLGLWLLASRDVFWIFRLDLLSEGFTHIQYQRFLLAAKPAFYLLALWPCVWAHQRWANRPSQALCFGVAAILFGSAVQVAKQADNRVGEVQVQRRASGKAVADADLEAAVDWLNSRWDARNTFWRVNYRTSRNEHTLMDMSLSLRAPLFKSGFTPGDNFVHKPESGKTRMLDALRVRYVVRVYEGKRDLPKQVARFGSIRITQRSLVDKSVGHEAMRARVVGLGTLTLVEGGDDTLRLDLSEANEETRVEFLIAGHPRWKVELDGNDIEWFESPIWGDGPHASVAGRQRGEWRGGRADGDDGSEPILLSVTPGRSGRLYLHYEASSTRDALALLLSILAAIGLLLVALERPRALRDRVEQSWPQLDRLLGWRAQLLLALLCGVLLSWRWHTGTTRQAQSIMGWQTRGFTADGRRVGALAPTKTDMLIRPSFSIRVKKNEFVDVELSDLPCAIAVRGWVALDDDAAKGRSSARYRVTLVDDEDAEQELVSFNHRPGRQFISLPAAQCEGRTNLALRLHHVAKARPSGKSKAPAAQTLGLWLEASDKTPKEASLK